jgi:hypothetical protein
LPPLFREGQRTPCHLKSAPSLCSARPDDPLSTVSPHLRFHLSSSCSITSNFAKIYLDKYCTSAVTWDLIVGDHLRRFTSFPRSLCVLRVSALDCSFSFVFFVFQLLTFNFQPSLPSNSFPHYLLSDPHPLNPVVSILYKNSGGRGCRFFRLSILAHSLEQACSKQSSKQNSWTRSDSQLTLGGKTIFQNSGAGDRNSTGTSDPS